MRRFLIVCLSLMAFLPMFAVENEAQNEEDAANEVTARIEQVSKDFYINLDYYDKYPSYERLCDKQRHLNFWAKFCTIYGIICAGIGGFDLGYGIADCEGYIITVGALCAAEGIAVAALGGSLRSKCTKTRKEIMQINSTGFSVSEVRLGKGSLSPTINLLRDGRTKDVALGVGMSVSF